MTTKSKKTKKDSQEKVNELTFDTIEKLRENINIIGDDVKSLKDKIKRLEHRIGIV
tara:strand:- start:956 stop:1123 length:168 start_codon:yes stop_codon:yes gene_type:complete